jgi:hypothetical protein
MIEDGAYFKGSIEIDRTATGGTETNFDKPAYTRTSSVPPGTSIAHAAANKTSN